MGIGGSPRQCARNLKRGLPTMPIFGWGRGGICPRSAFLLAFCLLLIDIVSMVLFFGRCYFFSFAHFRFKQALRGTVSGCFGSGLGSVLRVPVLGVPQNWALRVVYQLFIRNFFGTLTAVLLHRRKRILITTFFLSFLSISVL